MGSIFARKALLSKGWVEKVRLDIRAGRIHAIAGNASPGHDDYVAGIVIPGLCNAHSHAFQRALAGHTEQRSPAGQDNFWTWRERMYALAGRLDPDTLRAIAAQAYAEMLQSGYTSVAEFHYLHRAADAAADNDAMFEAIRDAAVRSGIRLTYVPVLYERAGFNMPEPEGVQRRFALDLPSFLAHHQRAEQSVNERMAIGIGVHSVRAVSAESLAAVVDAAETADIPLHLHVAEQQREVDECRDHYGRRPVEWLLESFDVGDRWCLVHATHMDAAETARLAGTGAAVCLCPSTEANLGDGLFPLQDFLRAGGNIAIGSDSHVSINPFEELRWLEYGQRLASQSRNIATLRDAHVGRELYTRVLQGGAQAAGLAQRGLARGAPADLVVLDDNDPMLLGHDDDSLLDALVFSGYRLPIDRVMVHGDWCVIGGSHVERDAVRADFAAAVNRIGVTA